MISVPCKLCEERMLGCHSECEKYKTFRTLKDIENKKERERKEKAYKEKQRIKEAVKRVKSGKKVP